MSTVILSIGIDGSKQKPRVTHVGMVSFGKKHAAMVPIVFPEGKTIEEKRKETIRMVNELFDSYILQAGEQA
jgi:hypothetical protein